MHTRKQGISVKCLYFFVENLSITTKACVLEHVFPPCGGLCQGWQCGQEEGQNTEFSAMN